MLRQKVNRHLPADLWPPSVWYQPQLKPVTDHADPTPVLKEGTAIYKRRMEAETGAGKSN